MIQDFDIPDHLLVAKISSARMIAPSDRAVDMPIDGGFVGMVDRETFDEWLRQRAVATGVHCVRASFDRVDRSADGSLRVVFTTRTDDGEAMQVVSARIHPGARRAARLGGDEHVVDGVRDVDLELGDALVERDALGVPLEVLLAHLGAWSRQVARRRGKGARGLRREPYLQRQTFQAAGQGMDGRRAHAAAAPRRVVRHQARRTRHYQRRQYFQLTSPDTA